jgi:hypothetical protein
MNDMWDLLAEVEAALAGSTAVAKSDYLRWAGSDDLAVKARAYRLSATAWERITPEPARDEQCDVMAGYLLRCLLEDPDGDDFVHSGFSAAHELAAWLKHLSGIPGGEPHIRRMSAALAEAFRRADGVTQNRIETGTLEHVLEEPALRPFFAQWASDPTLAEAYGHALAWGEAHEGGAG